MRLRLSRQEAITRPLRPAIVTPGSSISALGFTRSLGERGIPVFALGGGDGPGLYSRYCIPVKLGRMEPRLFLESVARIARHTRRRPVVLPCSDEAAALISSNKAAIEEFADAPVFRPEISGECLTKIGLDRGCRRLDVPHPRSAFPVSAKDLDVIESAIGYPCVLKPDQTKRLEMALGVKAILASTKEELTARFLECRRRGIDVFVQEFIPGGTRSNYGFAAYFDRTSTPHGIVTYRRLLDWPCDSPGISAMTENVHEPELEKAAVGFLKGLSFTGIVQAEYVNDNRDGKWKILDINPRAWTSNRLATALGCNIPWAAYSECDGSDIDPAVASGSFRWLNLMDSMFALMRKTLRGNPSVWRALTPNRTFVHAVLDREDPGPFASQITSLGLASRMSALTRRQSQWETADADTSG